MALSLSAHLVLFFLLVSAPSPPITILPPEPEPRVVVVTLTRPPPPPPPAPVIAEPPPGPAQAAPTAAPSPAPPRPVPARAAPRPRPVRTPPPPDVPTVPANPAPVVAAMAVIGEAQLAGALKAGTGQGTGSGAGSGGSGGASGGSCDMVRRLQDALRADPEVRDAVVQAHRAMPASGRAILVWDGDWIQDPGQAGKGLAGVRQAIALEIAFAPRECRTQPMRGLAVIAFADGPAAPRLALGEASWRWSDLLGAR